MEYQVRMAYEEEDVAAMVRTLNYRRRPEKNLRLAEKIGYPIFGVVLILVGISFLVGFVSSTPAGVVAALIGVVCIIGGIVLLSRSNIRAMEKRSWKQFPNKGLILTYTFYKDHFEEEDEVTGQHSYDYLTLASANEDENHIFLFTERNAGHIIRKDKFLVGDPEKFKDFIRRKCAITIDPID
jgi:hypothetical protein